MNEIRKSQVLSKINELARELSRDADVICKRAVDASACTASMQVLDGKFIDVQLGFEMLSAYFEQLWMLKEVDND